MALDKAALVASNSSLRSALATKIGRYAGRPRELTRRLGVDYAAGKRRRIWGRGPTQRAREVKAGKKAARAMKIVRVVGPRGRVLFTAGIKPSLGYGAEVTGFSDTQLLQAHRMEAKFIRTQTRGRQLQAVLALNDARTFALPARPS